MFTRPGCLNRRTTEITALLACWQEQREIGLIWKREGSAWMLGKLCSWWGDKSPTQEKCHWGLWRKGWAAAVRSAAPQQGCALSTLLKFLSLVLWLTLHKQMVFHLKVHRKILFALVKYFREEKNSTKFTQTKTYSRKEQHWFWWVIWSGLSYILD